MARHPHLTYSKGVDYEHHLLLVDCNNQYGYAMSQPLPIGDFEWMTPEELVELTPDNILNTPSDGSVGYFVECDLEYPTEIHDAHDEYPLAPEHYTVQESDLSQYQKKMASDFGVKVNKSRKLCLTLNNKTKYKLHISNLKQYIRLGLKLVKVHRGLKFRQKAWVKPYIELNTRLRQNATCKFEEVRLYFFLDLNFYHNLIFSAV